jgi:hypothetical protein
MARCLRHIRKRTQVFSKKTDYNVEIEQGVSKLGWARTKIVFAQRSGCEKIPIVKTLAFACRQNGDFRPGYLDTFPDNMPQGKSRDDLKGRFIGIYRDLFSSD